MKVRIETFKYIRTLLENNNTSLYNLKYDKSGSLYDGDYALVNILDDIHCLLGIKEDNESKFFVPQSWMPSNRPSRLITNKPAHNIKIRIIKKEDYNDEIV